MEQLTQGIDAAEWVLSRLESEESVAYAEVGCVGKESTDGSVTAETVRSATDLSQVGVWWRLFAEGSADYRFATSLETDHLDDLIERSIRSATVLDQQLPASYDRGTVHQAVHPGWAVGGSLSDFDADGKLELVKTALSDAVGGLSLDRAIASYRDNRIHAVVLTTTGTTVRTTLERAFVDVFFDPRDAPKRQRHFGSTAGASFLDSLPGRFDGFATDVREVAEWRARTGADESGADESAVADSFADFGDETEIVLGSRASAELFHHLAHYLEIDCAYFGSSPFSVGDRIGPDALTVEDTVRAGSWAGLAYDVEGRPTTPITLVSDGVVRNRLHDMVSAIEEGATPAGSVVPSIGYERPPRIHSRHLDVAAGDEAGSSLRNGADLFVEAVEPPRIENEATRTKRASSMPPSVLYAKDIADATPREFENEAAEQVLAFPIRIGYTMSGGERKRMITDGTVFVSLADIRSISGIGVERETVTGTCPKHRSMLPYAVTAPAIRFTARVHTD
ncbi:metallopeptidase TldD-related protein [Haladaptatus pallidirubidus]|uniref:Metalloprotease TldD/E C-terminal domain-containing protein n=1 Tax=Haladaptatus pallidirubidus TaxID=1008152 RepID=A0AAV3ULD8_9EURY|nr:metallopeptidase TldD-related protein [Haladaptatus pallidirubidus]